jgi:DNA-binding transcriptional MerR regulator
MTTLLSIGDFSRLTHVSVKALRHYHDVGLLAPAEIDRGSGYRLYAAAQAPTAQLIRRFRDMDMPLEQIKAVLTASDPEERDRVIVAHLRSMERQLEQTQATVTSLRALLEGGGELPGVELRSVDSGPALVSRARVGWNDTQAWLGDTLTGLRRQLQDLGLRRAGADGALYTSEFFEAHLGEVIAFIPVRQGGAEELRGGPMAVTVHRGSFADLDRSYAELGAFVAERGIGTAGPIREHYVVGFLDTDDDDAMVTEVCWPTVTTS